MSHCEKHITARELAAAAKGTPFQAASSWLDGESEEERHLRIADTRERYEAAQDLRLVAQGYRTGLGLPEPQCDFDAIVCELGRARQVADLHKAAPVIPEDYQEQQQAVNAYRDLVRQVDQQLLLVAGLGITVKYVPETEPYLTAADQAWDVIEHRHISIATIAEWPESFHPVLSNERGGEYDRFRAVHDLFGHVAVGGGFDRHGEFASWIQHASMFTGSGARAATTELHGENSFLAVYGRPAKHKAFLLPENFCAVPAGIV